MNSCCVPTPPDDRDGDSRWTSIHNRFLGDARDKDPEVIFLGDSVLQALGHTDAWNEWFAPLHSLNFSIHRDRTQNVLWRVLNGELDNVRPKAVVLHVGTDNVDDPPEDVADGILAIVRAIRERHPDVYVILPTLLPRGQHPNPLREKNATVNRLVARRTLGLQKTETVRIDAGFVQPDGTVSHHDMHDYLLLTNAGCLKAFAPVYESLVQILSDGETEKDSTPSE